MSEQPQQRIRILPVVTMEMTLIDGVDCRVMLGIDKLEQEAARMEQERQFRSDVARRALELKGVWQ